MSECLAIKLADTLVSGYVIAPAGFGKTHLIATSVSLCEGRQLILTHTYAGVNSLKTKLSNLKVSSQKYHVETIASFALKLALAYPFSSNWVIQEPSSQEEWLNLYDQTAQLLDRSFIRSIFCSTYDGVFVDEYQDCSNKQHNLITKLISFFPTRLLGDPLQAIFDFNGDGAVDWDKEIIAKLSAFGELKTPWRWKESGNEELGKWLYEIRESISQGKIPPAPIKRIKGFARVFKDIEDFSDFKRLSVFRNTGKLKGTSIVVFPGKNEFKQKAHSLSKALSGQFTSIEEVEGKSMNKTINLLITSNNLKLKLKLVIGFSEKCMTAIKKQFPKATIRGEIAKITKSTKNPLLVDACNRYLDTGDNLYLTSLIKNLSTIDETKIYRKDLLNRFLSILRYAESMSFKDATQKFQQEFRHFGRPIRSKNQIATTLLVKGLEYDHCIVVNSQNMSAKEFYVSVTRGCSSLTIVTKP